MYICHDIYQEIIRKGRISKNLEWLRQEDTKRNKKTNKIDERLREIDEKIDDLEKTDLGFWRSCVYIIIARIWWSLEQNNMIKWFLNC